MDYSVFLGLLTAVLIVLVAAGCYRFGMKGMPRPASRVIAIILAITALPGGFYVYSQRAEMARTTLFEAIIEGSAAGTWDPAPVREITFIVEHPKTTHRSWLVPMETRKNEVFDAHVLIRIIDPADAVLLEEETMFAPVKVVDHVRRKRPNTYKWTWEGKYFNFTPNLEGGHRVQITPLTAGIHRIHLLVRDPLKKDGKRLPGY